MEKSFAKFVGTLNIIVSSFHTGTKRVSEDKNSEQAAKKVKCTRGDLPPEDEGECRERLSVADDIYRTGAKNVPGAEPDLHQPGKGTLKTHFCSHTISSSKRRGQVRAENGNIQITYRLLH